MKTTSFRRAVIPKEEIFTLQMISLIYFVIEGALCALMLGWHFPVWPFLPIHLLLVLPLFFLLPIRKIEGATYSPYFILVFFFLGPFGAFVTLLFALYYPYRIRHGKTFIEWYEGLFPTEYFQEKFPIYERMMAEQEDYSSKVHLVPFTDIMNSGSEEEKTETINKILLYFRPAFTPALVAGLSDKNPVIRVRAATAVARLQGESVERREMLEERIRKNPQDEESIIALARSEEDYSQTAFVNEVERQEMLEKSISLYRRYLERNPSSNKERVRLAWLLFLVGRYTDSRKEIEQAIARGGIEGMGTLKVYLKILFQEKDYKKIRELAQKDYPFLEEQREEEIRLRDILLLWRLSVHDEEILDAS